MGNIGSEGCVGFLVEGTGACVLVDEAVSFLSGGQVHVWWYVLGWKRHFFLTHIYVLFSSCLQHLMSADHNSHFRMLQYSLTK